MRFIWVFALALAAATAQAGDVYKWKDKDGKVHYGDRPKTDAQAVELLNAEPVEEEGDPDAAKATAAREADCTRKKEQLAKYKSATAIKETDNLGQTREYSAAERDKFLAMQEKAANDACMPPPSAAAEQQ